MNRITQFAAALVAAVTITCFTGLAQTPAGALPQLAAGQSLGRALGIPTVPNLRDVGATRPGTARPWCACSFIVPTPSTR